MKGRCSDGWQENHDDEEEGWDDASQVGGDGDGDAINEWISSEND
jgi:hypothetical protein